jgi:hypothetical protein
VRVSLAVLAAAATAALGALVVGEYDLRGVGAALAGALFGLAVAEVLVSIARREASRPGVVAAAAVLPVGGLLWAGWISVHHRHQAIPGDYWLASAAGAAAAVIRVRIAGRR